MELLQTRIEKEPVENSELLQTRIEKEPVEKSELLQTRIEKEPVEKSDLLPVESTIVKTSTDPPTEQKRIKRIKRKKENKQKTQKKFRMQSHYKTANRVGQKCK